MKSNSRIKAYKRGHFAEALAAISLRFKGYRILATRYKTPVGEIDVIAKRRNVLVLVEVKMRKTETDALEAITFKNQSRVTQAAQYFISAHPACAHMDIRFDVIVMGWPFYWRHLDNAWQGRT
jgi:putative endonuclease